ncbi:uncharacterized protein [Littorina saxatilis]|uniref:Myb/SANT-like DNA-binding domain-containing protein n=1 Tax=Littorina saxatilis TaxID=31220 RepID=A0AAN9AM43_9CAEN
MEISAEESAKRARNANFSQAEVAVLLEEVALEKETINCSFNSHMTLQKKDRVWRAIQMRVNACGVANRSIKQLKAKLGTMKMDVRAKKRHGRGTGGGKPLPKPDFEEVVAEIIGKDSATFNGLEVDGTETFLKRHRIDSVSSTNGAPARHPSQSQALLMERPSTSLDGGPTMHSTPRREENRGVLHRVASSAILPITLDYAEPRIIEVEVHHETVPEAEGSSFREWQPLDFSSSSRANPSHRLVCTTGLLWRIHRLKLSCRLCQGLRWKSRVLQL